MVVQLYRVRLFGQNLYSNPSIFLKNIDDNPSLYISFLLYLHLNKIQYFVTTIYNY